MMNPSRNYYRPSEQSGNYHHNAAPKGERSSMDASRTTTSSSRDVSISNASDIDSEWIEEDEPGVYITIRQLVDGTRELRRVRFRYKPCMNYIMVPLEAGTLTIYILGDFQPNRLI